MEFEFSANRPTPRPHRIRASTPWTRASRPSTTSTRCARQRPDVRIHGIITHGGGAPSIVPAYAAASFSVRASRHRRAFEVLQKVIRCARSRRWGRG
ncbi:MAG: hypothetical protein R2854_24010 [Caldilineaceae bacterium]